MIYIRTVMTRDEMDRIEIEKQREIGKQLLIVDIIHYENDHVAKGGVSFVSRDQMTGWTSMDEKELTKIGDTCARLDGFNLASSAAWKYCGGEYEKNAYMFALSTYRRLGYVMVEVLDIEIFPDFFRKSARGNYEEYCKKHEDFPVGEEFADVTVFEQIMRHYLEFFVNSVVEAMDSNYDWDVIKRMLRSTISEERFELLRDYVKMG